MNKIIDWIDSRTGIKELLDHEVFSKQAPRLRSWYDFLGCFGGLSLILFIIQVATGSFLLIYYTNTTAEAFASVVFIDNDVVFGWLFRRIHAVGANVMIVLVMVHMLRVLITGAYKAPRELHWVSGFMLLMLTLVMGISGYLLPWTQLSFWAVTVLTKSFGSVPVVGDSLSKIVVGADTISQATLSRFFFVHLFLPVVMSGLLGAHFVMIRRTGISKPL